MIVLRRHALPLRPFFLRELDLFPHEINSTDEERVCCRGKSRDAFIILESSAPLSLIQATARLSALWSELRSTDSFFQG